MPFTYEDLILVRSNIIEQYVDIPVRCRLPGMTRDLTDDDKRHLAGVIAVMTHLNRAGVLKPEALELFPEPFRLSLEIIEEQAAVYSADARGAVKK